METAIIRRALKERWPVTAAARERVFKEADDTVANKTIDLELRQRAARLILDMDKLNLKEQEIMERRLPKHVVHTNMSTEELEKSIRQKMEELNLTEADIPLLKKGIAHISEIQQQQQQQLELE